MLRSLNEHWETDRFDSATNLAAYTRDNDKQGLVAHTKDGELAGFILYGMGYVWPPDRRQFHRSHDTGLIWDIIVHPRYWRQRIGTTLVRSAEEDLAEMGANKVTLFTGPANTRAQAFFSRLGYRVVGEAGSVFFERHIPRRKLPKRRTHQSAHREVGRIAS